MIYKPKNTSLILFLILCYSMIFSSTYANSNNVCESNDNYVHEILKIDESYDSQCDKGKCTLTYNGTVATYIETVLLSSKYVKGSFKYFFTTGAESSNYGICTSSSKGKLKMIKLKFADWGYSSNRLHVFFSSTPYSEISNGNDGNADITVSSSKDSIINITDDVSYVKLTSYTSMSFYSIDFVWEVESGSGGFDTEDLATFTRDNLTVGSLGTVCVPYNIESSNISGAQLYEIAGKKTTDNTSAGTVSAIVLNAVDESKGLTAGTPYIFLATDTELTLKYASSETGATAAGNSNGLYGTFTDYAFGTAASTDNIYIINSKSQIQKASSASGVSANRAYIKMDEVPMYTSSSSNGRSLIVDGNGYQFSDITTCSNGISLSKDKDSSAINIYNLEGQKCSAGHSHNPSIIIVDGKKLIKQH